MKSMIDQAIEAINHNDLTALKGMKGDVRFATILERCTGHALQCGHTAMVEWLLPQCVRDNEGFDDCLDIVLDTRNSECLGLVLLHWNDQAHCDKAIISAAADGNGWGVQRLVDRCSSMGISLALTYSARYGHDDVVAILYDWCTPEVLQSCHQDNPHCVYLATRLDAQQSHQDLTAALHHQDNHLTKPKKM